MGDDIKALAIIIVAVIVGIALSVYAVPELTKALNK